MGRDRKQHPDTPPPKVQRVTTLMRQFGVTPLQAFSFWRRYAYHLVDRDWDARRAMERTYVDSGQKGVDGQCTKFFAALMLEGITTEFFKEVGAHVGN